MGTRGLTTVIRDGQHIVAQYGQWDHYPTGQGKDALNILRQPEVIDRLRQAETRFISDEEHTALLKEVTGNDTGWMTFEEADKFKERYPQLSRDVGAQVLLQVALAQVAGETLPLVDQIEFANDSLFCEWAYVVDLDENTFEIYKGFQNEPHAEGRFAAESPQNGGYEGAKDYYPVKRVASYSLFDLPSDTEMEVLEARLYAEDEEEQGTFEAVTEPKGIEA